LFQHDPVTLDVLVPNGSWQVAAHPVGGWPVFPLRLTSVVILAIGVTLSMVVVVIVRRWERERRTVARVSDNLTRLVDSTTSPIVAVDGSGRISEWNRAIVELTGLTKEDAASRVFDDLCGAICAIEPDSAGVRQAVEAICSGEAESAEAQVKLGTPPRSVVFFITPRIEAGGDRGAVLVGHDITTRLDAERMRTENLALARSARLKDEFLAGMSHELRTPLNAIIGLSSVLNRRTFGELTEKQAEYVGQIGASGQHLLSLINEVLDLAKLDAEKVELEIEACDAAGIVQEALDLIRPLAARRGVAVGEVPSAERHLLAGDCRRLRQVLVNLVSNAVKFTERGGRMGVEVETRGEDVVITVWDTGVGIHPDQQNLLFQPFLQVDGSLSREQEGTGLGLAIAAKLVALHDGTIAVDSRPGRGSRFTVVLPRTGPSPSDGLAVAFVPLGVGTDVSPR
jgi:PAS domain S-box-containing protein